MKNKIKSHYLEFALALFGFGIIMFPKQIILFYLVWVTAIIYGKTKNEIQFSISYKLLPWVILYCLYLFFILFTRNPEWAGKYAENKLSFFLIPLLFSFRQQKKPEVFISLSGIVLATSFQLFLLIFRAFLFSTDQNSLWFSSFFSFIHHPTYLSVFITVSCVIMIFGWYKNWKYYNPRLIIPLISLHLIGIYFCASLAGVLFLMILIGVFIFYFSFKKSFLVGCLTFFIFCFSATFLYLKSPRIQSDVYSAYFFLEKYIQSPERFVKQRKYPEASGTEVRLIMWTVTWQSCMQFPLGVGTGNVDEVISNNLRKIEQNELAKVKLNPHNQFLQTFLEIGIFGLLILLLIIFYPFYSFKVSSNILPLILATNLGLNMLFESMLQHVSGIVFYPFAFGLFYLMNHKE